MSPTLLVHNFVDMGPFLTKPVPMESPIPGLLFETGFVKNGPIARKTVNQLSMTLFSEPLKLRRVIMIRPGDTQYYVRILIDARPVL